VTKRESTPPLPPLHGPPRRSLTPPARKQISGIFDIDAETPAKNPGLTHYQALLSVFDSMTNGEREMFTELGFIVRQLSEHGRRVLMVAARKLAESGK
jgi:hypothetical protein